jgi:Transposase DDE domain group 1
MTPRTSKVRREATGGKAGDGNTRRQRVRRPDPRKIAMGPPDPTVSGVAGLVALGAFLRDVGVDDELRQFDGLKRSPTVVYPMSAQLRLLVDAFAVGETRVFGIEGLASDRLFVHLAGSRVPSIDTLYADVGRFDDASLAVLENMMASHGLARLPLVRGTYAYFDLDTTVVPIFGEHEGALPGPNPKYRGRPSFHPMLARSAETGTIIGAQLRRGDTGFGVDDVPTVRAWVRRAKSKLHKDVSLCLRMDSAGDCAELLRGLHDEEVFYLVKAKLTADLLGQIEWTRTWRTTDKDGDGRPTRQVAEVQFSRKSWNTLGVKPKVIAVRSRERYGKQVDFGDGDWTVQVFLTNRTIEDESDVAWDYDKRAGVEPLIAECKGAWGIAHASSYAFAANHAVLLLKLLALNLLDRYATERFPTLPRWRSAWRRRTLLRIPGRLTTSGRRRILRLPPGSPLLFTPQRE